MTDEKVILEESDEAATRTTVTGWVSRQGDFYGDRKDSEWLARNSGCTHWPCHECGAILPKGTRCEPCYERGMAARFAALPVVEWDGKTPLAEFGSDNYFFDEQAVQDHAEELGVPVSSLRLVLCVPVPAPQVNACDLLANAASPGDDDVDDHVTPAVREVVNALNEALQAGAPYSWWPGEQAVRLDG